MTDNNTTKHEKSLMEPEHETEDEEDVFFAADEQTFESESIQDNMMSIEETRKNREPSNGSVPGETSQDPENSREKESEKGDHTHQPSNDPKSVTKESDEEGLKAASEPDSPKPKALKPLEIVTDQVRTSIDVPAGENMADFMTPPTPGTAPTSTMTLEDIEKVVDDLGIHERVSSSETKKNPGSVPLSSVDFSRVRPNVLFPRDQEAYGKMNDGVSRMKSTLQHFFFF